MNLLIGHRQVLDDDPLAERLEIHLEEHYQYTDDKTIPEIK